MTDSAVWKAEEQSSDIGEQVWDRLEEKGAQVSLHLQTYIYSHKNLKQAQGHAVLVFLPF